MIEQGWHYIRDVPPMILTFDRVPPVTVGKDVPNKIRLRLEMVSDVGLATYRERCGCSSIKMTAGRHGIYPYSQHHDVLLFFHRRDTGNQSGC